MTRHDHLMEQYEDALFALLMDGVAEAEGEEALLLNEVLKEDPDAEVPEEINKHCENTIRTAFAQKRMRAARHTAMRCLAKIALVAVISGLLFTAAFALSEDVRVATLNAIIQVMDDRTQITFTNQHEEGNQNASYENNNIVLTWLPNGFQLESSESNNARSHVSYIDSVGALISVSVIPYHSGLVYNFDTEDCTKSTVMVQGHSATLYSANAAKIQSIYADNNMPDIWSDMTLIWIDEENQVIINIFANNLTESEILKLADGFYLE